ncbi:Flp pilus assembly protein CpaB [Vampirovibrio sp.]|uniref:Flp pilus assembly protein CpaB n=1 Tax=Vampirovibrio sp. TaxID=2717857 RepID=UPI0035941FFC
MPTPNLPIKTGHVFIGLAVVMGITTVSLFSGGKPAPKVQAQQKIETVEVVVPLVQINQGQTLSLNDLTRVQWPAAFLPRGETFDKPYMVSGRVAKQTLFPGEPIFIQKVSGSNSAGGLTALIPVGKRAVTIAVSEIKGVAGFVKPGDHVDILSTFEIERNDEKSLKKTTTVLQNILVLASAQTMVKDDDYNIETPEGVEKGTALKTSKTELAKKNDKANPENEKAKKPEEIEKRLKEKRKAQKEAAKEAKLVSSVTLAVNPDQVELLALAEESGELRLSLRSEADNSIADLSGQNSDQLHGKPMFVARQTPEYNPPPPPPPSAMPPSAPPMPAPFLGAQVEFIQGDDKTLYNFNP